MKLGVNITAFREKWIAQIIEQFDGVADRIVVTVPDHPWHGDYENDDTPIRAKQARVKDSELMIIESLEWDSEAEQRNDAQEQLRGMDYVVVSHGDTFFTRRDLKMAKMFLEQKDSQNLACKTYTYWKNFDTVINPDILLPTIFVKGDSVFTHAINVQGMSTTPEVLDLECHHVSWVKTDEEVLAKIKSYGHATEVMPDWYKDVWKGWHHKMVDIGPTSAKDFGGIRHHSLPQEIREKL